VTERLRARIEADFGPDRAARVVDALRKHRPPLAALQDRERLLTAIVLMARGDQSRLDTALSMSGRDWRDTLVASGLANFDWPTRLRDELGDAPE